MPVEISDWNDLDNVRNDQNGDYVLVNDLDSDTNGYAGIGDDWNPIGDQAFLGDGYDGVFDGGGFQIRDLIVDDTDRNVGLFSILDGGGEIENLFVVGDIATSSDSFNAGVLCSSNNGSIENCGAGGSVTASSLDIVGGLVGRNEGTITNSYATASVNGNDIVGGLVGNNFGSVQTSYAVGPTSATSSSADVGGLIGRQENSVENSYWDTESTGQSTSDGDSIGLTTAEMQGSEAEANMDELDFLDVWETVEKDENDDDTADGYPILIAIDREAQIQEQIDSGYIIIFDLSVETNPATNISEFSATLNGELVELDDTADDADVFFEFGENVTDSQTSTQTLTEEETFDELVDGISSNTRFEFRAVAEAQDPNGETVIAEGDVLTFDTEIVTLDGTISLNEVGVENAEVVVNNLTQATFGGQTTTDADGNYIVELPDADPLDTAAVAVDFDDGEERYGRLVTTVLE